MGQEELGWLPRILSQKGGTAMQAVLEAAQTVWEAVLERCCGLDVHQKRVTACLLIGALDQQPKEFLRTFTTTTKGLLELRDWLEEKGCTPWLSGARAYPGGRCSTSWRKTDRKLSSVVSVVFGVSGRAMLEALLTGETSPQETAELARGRLRRKIPELIEALEGRVDDHHRFLIRIHLEHLAYLEQAIAQLHEHLDEREGRVTLSIPAQSACRLSNGSSCLPRNP